MQISMWPLTIAGVVAHRLSGSRARLVLSDHSALSKQYAHFGACAKALLRLSIRFVYPMADARIVVSHGAADDLARLSGLRRDKIEVVYNPVERPGSGHVAADADRLWGDAKPRILSVGRLKSQKNHLLLIRSFARLRRRIDARLIILGDGELRPDLEAAIAEEGLEQEVLLPGFRDPWPYYETADLFALSSDIEGFGLVLVEAMRCGLTIVSTDCIGAREVLDDGKYGYQVPIGDDAALAGAMEAALSNRLDPGVLRARAEELSGQGASDRYLELMLGRQGPEGVSGKTPHRISSLQPTPI
jgi:glycosyltransferase involved in cell wall biosynthesis